MEAAEGKDEEQGEKEDEEKDCVIDRAAAPTTAVYFELEAVEVEGARQLDAGENGRHCDAIGRDDGLVDEGI